MFPYIWTGVCETPKLLYENTSKAFFLHLTFLHFSEHHEQKGISIWRKTKPEDWCGKGKCPKLFVLAVDSPGWAVQVSAALQCCWVCSVWEMQTEGPAAPWHSWDLPLPGFFIAIWALALLISHSPCLSRQDCGVGQKNNHLLWFFRERKKNNRDYFLFVIYLHLSLGVMILLPIQFWFQDDESPIESK